MINEQELQRFLNGNFYSKIGQKRSVSFPKGTMITEAIHDNQIFNHSPSMNFLFLNMKLKPPKFRTLPLILITKGESNVS